MANIISTHNTIDCENFNKLFFNEYLFIILNDTESYNTLFDELNNSIKQNNTETLIKYKLMFQKFNENFIFTSTENISNNYKKFVYVERSLNLLNLIKQLKV